MSVAQVTRRKKKREWWVAGFLLPAVVLFAGFVVVPVIVAVVVSFFTWTGFSGLHFSGLTNWRFFIHDGAAMAALERSGVVVLGCLIIQEPIALVLGIFAAGYQRYRAVLIAIYFLPLLISAAAVGVLWGNLLSPVGGGIQYAGEHFGLGFLDHNFLGSSSLALPTVIVLVSWEFIPFHTLLYQAGARQIPASLYEAGMIDGVGPWQRVRRITLPLMRNTIVTSTTLNIVGSLTVFDLIYTLTGGGPGQSTDVLALHQYLVGFGQLNYGYASVLAVVLGVIGMAASFVIIRVTGFGRMTSMAEGA